MIWIFEDLSEKEKKKLERLNPLMDYAKSINRDHLFNTFCSRLEIIGGQVQDVRKAKFFNIHQTKQGFICDDFEDAKDLSQFISNGENSKEIFLVNTTPEKFIKKYPFILPYIQKRKLFGEMEWVAIPVDNFIERCAEDGNWSLLDHLDLGLLKKSGIKYHKYIKRKEFNPYPYEIT